MALELDKMTRLPGDEAFRRESIKGTQWESTYAGALSFMRRKYTRDLTGVDIAVTGIPFDQAVSPSASLYLQQHLLPAHIHHLDR